MAKKVQEAPRLIRRREVEKRTGHARSTLYGWVRQGAFPRPIRTGARTVAWVEAEVDAWVRERVEASREAAAR